MHLKRSKPGKPNTNREIIKRYTNQPDKLPDDLRMRIEQDWAGESVQLYAMADLNGSMQLEQRWIAIGPSRAAVAKNGKGAPEVHSFDRAKIQAVKETPGLSSTVLHIQGDPNEPPLAVLRYTHRQRRAMENIKYLLDPETSQNAIEEKDPDALYAKAMSQSVREAQAAVAGKELTVVWRLIGYMKPYKKRVAIGMICAALMTVISLLPPYLTKRLVDDIIKPFEGGAFERSDALWLAGIMIGALAVTFILRAFLLYARLRSMAVLGELVARDLRKELYEHLQRLSLNFYSSKQTGSIISRVSHDTDRLWDFIAFGMVEVSLAVIMLFGLGAVLLCMDLQLGALMILPVPVMLWSFFAHSKVMSRLFLRAWRKWTRLTEVLSDTIPGMRVVKAFNQENFEIDRFSDRNSNATLEFNAIHGVWTKFWPGVIFGLHVITLIVWIFATPRLLQPAGAPNALSIGTFMAFLLYMGMYFQPIETIGMITRMMNRATTSAYRVFEILDTEPDITDKQEAVRLEPVQGRVVFENVSFAYDGIRPVIRDISFEVEPGEMIGLVGPSGAGKTTVTNLIVRFYESSSGRILIDGVDLRDLDTGHLRRQVGMVLQDPHLFHGTILENIRYGEPDADISEVVAAAKAANAHEFICKLPNGYDTIVGERGHTLSGGERQRVSIARAILCNPRILILDEATSSVDTETERKIQEALERLIEGRTVFAVAHRLSTLRRADRLFVLEDGQIVEHGRHAELLAKEDGVYRKLHNLQHELHEMYAV
ncbi:ABC transporter ATP-binding protein [Candidatus Sumerlaeota bacterium]|nr:ABC transporter ATP-binding protein [Candidatus Sumerlaeota bacterium]